jgi:hypothetical protein
LYIFLYVDHSKKNITKSLRIMSEDKK